MGVNEKALIVVCSGCKTNVLATEQKTPLNRRRQDRSARPGRIGLVQLKSEISGPGVAPLVPSPVFGFHKNPAGLTFDRLDVNLVDQEGLSHLSFDKSSKQGAVARYLPKAGAFNQRIGCWVHRRHQSLSRVLATILSDPT